MDLSRNQSYFSLCVVALAVSVTAMCAPSNPAGQSDNRVLAETVSQPTTVEGPDRYHRNRIPKRAGEYYNLIWGVDTLSVRAVESGALIRFTYRVIDPEKAKIFNDKNVAAFLDAPSANARLSIPSLEKVGQLRQNTTEETGKYYWMAFSNPRRTVKRGDHVNVVIGRFHADGLVVE